MTTLLLSRSLQTKRMKKFLCLIFGASFTFFLSAQPTIQWQKCLGGTNYDAAASAQQTNDGGYIVVGLTQSVNGDITTNHGVVDVWVIKLAFDGNIQWQKTLGGSSIEVGNSIQKTTDGGFIIAGYTLSNDGDVSGNHGSTDCWIVKLDSNGDIQWQKTLGGSQEDRATAIQQTQDGGYIFAGHTNSSDGDVSTNHGVNDFWVVKLSSTGTIEWEKALGGTGADEAYSISQTSDGGYVIGGATRSNNGDVSGNNGNTDYWVVKLTNSGTIEWQKALGGTGADDGRLAYQTSDGGYLVAGTQGSGDGQVSVSLGWTDYWIVKLNQTGDIQWEKSLGGSEQDVLGALLLTEDGGCVLSGFTESKDGDVMNNNVIFDIWVVKLNILGEIQWSKAIGGSLADFSGKIHETSDGGYVLAGTTESLDGDVSGNHGIYDCWVVKLSPESSPTSEVHAKILKIFPNPATNTISIKIPEEAYTLFVQITDLLGQVLSHQTISTNQTVDVSTLPNGLYILSAVTTSGTVFSGKFSKLE